MLRGIISSTLVDIDYVRINISLVSRLLSVYLCSKLYNGRIFLIVRICALTLANWGFSFNFEYIKMPNMTTQITQ